MIDHGADAAGPGDAPLQRPAAASVLLGQGYQGAVYRVETDDGPVIVKKVIGRGLPRILRRAMLRREHAIYQRLAGVNGVPACRGLLGGEELVLDYVPGPSLREPGQPVADRARFFDELLAIIQAVHAAGVAHGDLKRKDNILVGPGGHPVLIDFGTAVAMPDGAGAWRRWLFQQVARIDLNAWIKLKYQRQDMPMDPGDLQYYRPSWLERTARLVRRAWRKLTLRSHRRGRRR